MLRRKLSAGLLRQAANASAGSPVTAGIVPKPGGSQSANLASAVLLSSQTNWRNETVVMLKQELKKRGLSQQGNKAELIARLSSAETSSLLPPVPPIPQSLRKTTSSPLLRQKAHLSTSTPRAFPKSGSAGEEQVTTTGPEVHTDKTAAPKIQRVSADTVTVAPGLPETKDAGKGSEAFMVKIPQPKADEEIDQIIPSVPDNFRTPKKTPSPSSTSGIESLPKVMTVASAATHPAGGPTHALHTGSDAHEHEVEVEVETENSSSSSSKSLEEGLEGLSGKDIPGLGEALMSVLGAPGRAIRSMGLDEGALPPVGVPGDGGDGGKNPAKREEEKEYKANDKPLDGDEKRGLYILGGVLALGWLVGGSKSDKKDKDKKKKDHGEEGGKGGVKGDAKWEKASGAGIVGHGSRKD